MLGWICLFYACLFACFCLFGHMFCLFGYMFCLFVCLIHLFGCLLLLYFLFDNICR